jgi:SAM-dependent methyltransferase/uncharacterized protein YjiS (DUF1127 family)
MSRTSLAASAAQTPAPIDLTSVKTRQQGAWSSGDYAVVGTTLQIVGEQLCEALDLRAGQRVLDVAAGNGNVTLAAAQRWCDVVSTDYVPALLERGRERAAAERLAIDFRQADAELLPFAGAAFDVVVSTFGVMFTPDQERAAAEMIRVCKPGGKIGLANWTPDGFIGQVFKTIGKHLPPPEGIRSPALWVPARASPKCSAKRRPRSGSSDAHSPSATARRDTGSRFSRPITGHCSRRSARSSRARNRPWPTISSPWSGSSTAQATTRWSCRATTSRSSSSGGEAGANPERMRSAISYIPMHNRFVEGFLESEPSAGTLDPLSSCIQSARPGGPAPDEALRRARLSRGAALGVAVARAGRLLALVLAKPTRQLIERFAARRRRERAAAELYAVDERTLADLGLRRADIPFILVQRGWERHDPRADSAEKRANDDRDRRHAGP